MRLIVAIAVVVVVSVANAQDKRGLATLDAWHGWRGVRLGQTREQIGGTFKLIGSYQKDDPSVLVFERGRDDLHFDGVPLTSIHYLFYEDRLVRIALEANGRETVDRLEKAIVAHFGESNDGLVGGITWSTDATELLLICTDENRACTSAVAVFSDSKAWMKWAHGNGPGRAEQHHPADARRDARR